MDPAASTFSSSQPPSRNVILIGFMGTGKSTVGKWLARRLNYAFLDTDQMIQDLAGVSIPEIFQQEGEAGFRLWESRLQEKGFPSINTVIATGGGFPMAPGRMDWLRSIGYVVCLLASPEGIYERIKTQTHRPLLQVDDPLAEIRRILHEREAVYRQAHMEILTEGRPLKAIGEDILRHLRR
jgi:shikimate kinase